MNLAETCADMPRAQTVRTRGADGTGTGAPTVAPEDACTVCGIKKANLRCPWVRCQRCCVSARYNCPTHARDANLTPEEIAASPPPPPLRPRVRAPPPPPPAAEHSGDLAPTPGGRLLPRRAVRPSSFLLGPAAPHHGPSTVVSASASAPAARASHSASYQQQHQQQQARMMALPGPARPPGPPPVAPGRSLLPPLPQVPFRPLATPPPRVLLRRCPECRETVPALGAEALAHLLQCRARPGSGAGSGSAGYGGARGLKRSREEFLSLPEAGDEADADEHAAQDEEEAALRAAARARFEARLALLSELLGSATAHVHALTEDRVQAANAEQMLEELEQAEAGEARLRAMQQALARLEQLTARAERLANRLALGHARARARTCGSGPDSGSAQPSAEAALAPPGLCTLRPAPCQRPAPPSSESPAYFLRL